MITVTVAGVLIVLLFCVIAMPGMLESKVIVAVCGSMCRVTVVLSPVESVAVRRSSSQLGYS